MLETPDLPRTIDFYTRVLGFELDGIWPSAEDPTWCRLVAGGASLMFITREEALPPAAPAITGQLYCYPPDVDAMWKELSGRVEVVAPLETRTYGRREFQIRDCNGYVLRFGAEAGQES